MKKVILSLAAMALVLSSCKKDFHCDCEEKFNGVETNNNGKHIGFKEKSEGDASVRCSTYEYTIIVDTTTVTFDCTLTGG